jgi:hypothetical protein
MSTKSKRSKHGKYVIGRLGDSPTYLSKVARLVEGGRSNAMRNAPIAASALAFGLGVNGLMENGYLSSTSDEGTDQ